MSKSKCQAANVLGVHLCVCPVHAQLSFPDFLGHCVCVDIGDLKNHLGKLAIFKGSHCKALVKSPSVE